MSATENLHLPDECWESVFKFLNHHRYLEPLSLVCKQFLSITNRLRSNFRLKICDPTLPFLPQLFRRFPNLTSLDLTRFHNGDLDALLHQISNSGLPLLSLDLSEQHTFPYDGLRALSKKITTLKSLKCSSMRYLTKADLLLIVDCFPFLEELNISFYEEDDNICPSHFEIDDDNDFNNIVSRYWVQALPLGLPKLRKVNLSGNHLGDAAIFNFCNRCELLEEVVIFYCTMISQHGIASAIRERPNLISLSVNGFGRGMKHGELGRPNVTSDFIGSLVSLKSLNCIDLSDSRISDELLLAVAEEGLPLRKLVLRGCSHYSYVGIFSLLSNCQLVQHLDLQNAEFLNDQCVSELTVFLGNLISINLSGARITNSGFLALTRNCPLLCEIKMEDTDIGKQKVEDPLMDFVVNSQVKFLHLARNPWLRDESIEMFASICPNLEMLDLSFCQGIYRGVVVVLKRCCNLRYLSLDMSWNVNLRGLNFEVPKLEVLNLSQSRINDDALYAISKSCHGLLHLDLEFCYITEKGVKQVVENCRQLREINLLYCDEVAADVVPWMVFSRPSLRTILIPPSFHLSESQRELFLGHGCLVVDVSSKRFWNWRCYLKSELKC